MRGRSANDPGTIVLKKVLFIVIPPKYARILLI